MTEAPGPLVDGVIPDTQGGQDPSGEGEGEQSVNTVCILFEYYLNTICILLEYYLYTTVAYHFAPETAYIHSYTPYTVFFSKAIHT